MSVVTEEGFHTILLEYGYPAIVIRFLWDGRPDNCMDEDRVRRMALAGVPISGTIEALLLEEDKYAT